MWHCPLPLAHGALLAAAFAALLPAQPAAPSGWTRFRGPNGSGVSPDSGFPVAFGPANNLAWRVPVHPGKSSPVLDAKHVFLTGAANGKLYTQCFDRQTGKLVWEREESRPRDEQGNALNHHAAPTPTVDRHTVYVFFKDLGLLAYNAATGKRRWLAPLGPWTVSMGVAASPVLAGRDTVIILADQMEGSFVAGFSTRDGEMRWKTPRREGESWTTPLLMPGQGTGAPIVTVGRGLLGLHDAASGRRLADVEGITPANVASPIADGDTVYFFGYGNDAVPPFAQQLSRRDRNQDGVLTEDEYGADAFLRSVARYNGNRDGVVSEEEWNDRQRTILGHNGVMAFRVNPARPGEAPRELWRTPKALNGVIPSPLLFDGVLYIVRNGGILLTLDAATGRILGESRVTGALGGFSASPVAAAGDRTIYLANEEGKVAVLRAGKSPEPQWEVIAVNDLGEPCFATPALAQGQVYIRTGEALYRFDTIQRGR